MKTLVFTFGRFNPPHKGHEKLINLINFYQNQNKTDTLIGVSRTHDKNNPLSPHLKLSWLQGFFPNTNFKLANKHYPTFMQMLQHHSIGYKKLIYIVGDDRYDEISSKIRIYNEELFRFKHLEFINAGYRDEASDGVTGMSGSKMRSYVQDGNIDEFMKGLPTGNIDCMPLWNQLREEMK